MKAIRSNWKKTVALLGVSVLGLKFAQKKYRSVTWGQVNLREGNLRCGYR